jgi:hypothetical protein
VELLSEAVAGSKRRPGATVIQTTTDFTSTHRGSAQHYDVGASEFEVPSATPVANSIKYQTSRMSLRGRMLPHLAGAARKSQPANQEQDLDIMEIKEYKAAGADKREQGDKQQVSFNHRYGAMRD